MARRDQPPVRPPLHSGVIPMTEFVSHLANTAEAGDDVEDSHIGEVRFKRTFVNVESVRRERDDACMANDTIGERLIALKERARLSLDEIAAAAGYAGRSSVQKLFSADYAPQVLSNSVATRLERALVGKGTPPIGRDELWSMTGIEANTPERPEVSVEVLEVILPEILRRSTGLEMPAGTARPTATVLALCIELVGANPSIHANPDALRAVAHAAAAQLPGSRQRA